MENAAIGRFAASRSVHNRFYFRDHDLIERALVALALEPENIGPSKTVLADIECALLETDKVAVADIRNGVSLAYRRVVEPLIAQLASLDAEAAKAALDDAHSRYLTRLPVLLDKHSKTFARVRTLLLVRSCGENVVAFPFK